MFKGFLDKAKGAIEKIDVKSTLDTAKAATSEHLSSAKSKASELLDNSIPHIKELANKAKCATGFHAGSFQKVEGKPECYREKICPNCLELITEQKHQFPEVSSVDYDDYGSCKKTLKCLHCTHEKYVHDHYGFSPVGTNGYCEQIEKCTRCKEERNTHTKVHSWMKRGNNEDGTVNYECLNCGSVEQRKY
ncbi:MAG TPA: hypothetical protein PKC44_10775 [Agitococcus sp.]|nr:hypothetical protein [Agitococcus sp.]